MLQSTVRTGELDIRLTFIEKIVQNPITNEDLVYAWQQIVTYPTVWARKKELPGTEVFIADRLTYVQRTIFTIRYRDDLDVKMRCVFDGRVYEILSITEIGTTRKKFQDVTANLIDNETFT